MRIAPPSQTGGAIRQSVSSHTNSRTERSHHGSRAYECGEGGQAPLPRHDPRTCSSLGLRPTRRTRKGHHRRRTATLDALFQICITLALKQGRERRLALRLIDN